MFLSVYGGVKIFIYIFTYLSRKANQNYFLFLLVSKIQKIKIKKIFGIISVYITDYYGG